MKLHKGRPLLMMECTGEDLRRRCPTYRKQKERSDEKERIQTQHVDSVEPEGPEEYKLGSYQNTLAKKRK